MTQVHSQSDSRSLHLVGMRSVAFSQSSRRELFRSARSELLRHCGESTLAGIEPTHKPDADLVTCWLAVSDEMIQLNVGQNTIGRQQDNDIVLVDECISRRHCVVLMHSDGRCELHEMASKNGTKINGVRIYGPTVLHDGDEIAICSRRIRFMVRPIKNRGSSSR